MIFIAAAIPIVYKFIEAKYIDIVLLVPLFFILLGVLLFEHDYQIIIKADFKHNNLEPVIENKLKEVGGLEDKYFNYPKFQHESFTGSKISYIRTSIFLTIRYLLAILPVVISLIVFTIVQNECWAFWQIVLFSIDVLGLLLYIFISAHFFYTYKSGLIRKEID
jgi:hypothetical protein